MVQQDHLSLRLNDESITFSGRSQNFGTKIYAGAAPARRDTVTAHVAY